MHVYVEMISYLEEGSILFIPGIMTNGAVEIYFNRLVFCLFGGVDIG